MFVGPFAQLLLSRFPEVRADLEEVLEGEARFRESLGTFDDDVEISPYQMSIEFRERLLLPALGGNQGAAALLKRCADFLLEAAMLDPSPDGMYREAIAIRVFERIDPEDRDKLFQLSPQLRELFPETG